MNNGIDIHHILLRCSSFSSQLVRLYLWWPYNRPKYQLVISIFNKRRRFCILFPFDLFSWKTMSPLFPEFLCTKRLPFVRSPFTLFLPQISCIRQRLSSSNITKICVFNFSYFIYLIMFPILLFLILFSYPVSLLMYKKWEKLGNSNLSYLTPHFFQLSNQIQVLQHYKNMVFVNCIVQRAGGTRLGNI